MLHTLSSPANPARVKGCATSGYAGTLRFSLHVFAICAASLGAVHAGAFSAQAQAPAEATQLSAGSYIERTLSAARNMMDDTLNPFTFTSCTPLLLVRNWPKAAKKSTQAPPLRLYDPRST